MLSFLGWLHVQLFRLVLMLTVAVVRLPLKALGATLKAIAALLGEEFQRWAGIFVGGLMVYLAARAALLFDSYPGRKWVLLTVALMGCAWLFALLKSISYTIHNNLRAVRTRQMFRALDKRTAQLPEQLNALRQEATSGAAKKAKGTVLEGAFYENRSAKAAELEQARAAEEQAETAAREAAAQAARDQAAAEERERHQEWVASLEPDPFSEGALTDD